MMSTLDEASHSRIDDFKNRLLRYKSESKMTFNDLSIECELDPGVIRSFIRNKKGTKASSMYKIHLATGIAL